MIKCRNLNVSYLLAKLVPVSFLILFNSFFIYTASQRQQTNYDNHATMETARAILKADPYTYDFHSWRITGNIYYIMGLAYFFGFEGATRALYYFSVFWVCLGLIAAWRIYYRYLTPALAGVGVIIIGTLPSILHLTAIGLQDMILFALAPVLLLVLTDHYFFPQKSFYRFLIYWVLSVFGMHIRITFYGFSALLILAIDWKKKKWISIILRQLLLLLGVVVCLAFQLLCFVMMRGREYGWLTFKETYLGLMGAHSGYGALNFTNPIWDIFLMFCQGFGPLIMFFGILGILIAIVRRESWAKVIAAWALWITFHIILTPLSQIRYFLPASTILVLGFLYCFKSSSKVLRIILFLSLLIYCGKKVPEEISYNLLPSHKQSLAQIILDDLEDWQPQKNRVFWMGQIFTTTTALTPNILEDSFYNIYSIGTSSFNYEMRTRIKMWYPQMPIDWSQFKSWDSGIITNEMLKYALDGDIFLISPAPAVYQSRTLPPLGAREEIHQLTPSDYQNTNLPPVQMPLIIQRLRRDKIHFNDQQWKAGTLALKGDRPVTWSGWPKAGRLFKNGEHWELLWIDHYQLYDRLGNRLLSQN